MLRKTSFILTLLLLLVTCSVAKAQYNNPRGRLPKQLLGLSIGARAGGVMYFGDLVDSGRFRWTAGAYVEKTILSWFSLRAMIEAGQAHGSQKWGIEFKTFFTDLNLVAKVHFLDLLQGYDDSRSWNPYFGVGAGGMLFSCKKNPTDAIDVDEYLSRAEAGGWEDLANKWLYNDGGMQGTADVLGLVGVRYAVSSKLWITCEAQGNLLFTDLFDAHDGYPNGNGTWIQSEGKFDALWNVTFGVQYRFYNVSKFTSSSKYSRKAYLKTRKIYERNAKRVRRR